MKIDISKFDDGLNHLEMVLPARGINLMRHGHIITDIKLNASFDKRQHDLSLKAKVSASALLICDRCLKKFEKTVSSGFEVYFTTKLSDSESSGIRYFNPSDPIIDLREEIHSALVLVLPIKTLCVPDCKGLCPVCGANRNDEDCSCVPKLHDNRWEKLKEIQFSRL